MTQGATAVEEALDRFRKSGHRVDLPGAISAPAFLTVSQLPCRWAETGTIRLMTNYEIAWRFQQIADTLEIQGENPFKVRAYRRAVEAIEGLTEPLSDI